MIKVSIIIRTKNESKWISFCIKSLLSQKFDGEFEIIIIDSGSVDNTLDIVKYIHSKAIIVLKNNEPYLPGKFINYGIENSCKKSSYYIILSAHCIPTSNSWLQDMVNSIKDNESIAGMFCKQIPCRTTNYENKRDLINNFGDDILLKEKDSFFHNAASIVKRNVINKFPFCNHTKHIEDRKWADVVLKNGYKTKYDPNLSVIHEHGLNQHKNEYSSIRGEGVAKLQNNTPELVLFDKYIIDLASILIIPINYSSSFVSELRDNINFKDYHIDSSNYSSTKISLKDLIKKKIILNMELTKTFFDFTFYINCNYSNNFKHVNNLYKSIVCNNYDMSFLVDELKNDFFLFDNSDDNLVIRTEDIMNKYASKEHLKLACYELGCFLRSNYLLNNLNLGDISLFRKNEYSD